jgi:hypothetical protein
MLESVIMFLIYVCIVALVFYLIIWVLGAIGVSLPDIVIKILWVIFALIVILFLVRLLLPMAGGRRLLGMLDWLPMLA